VPGSKAGSWVGSRLRSIGPGYSAIEPEGLSLAQLAKSYEISRTSVARSLKRPEVAVPKTPLPPASTDTEYLRISKNI
jgi:hypothetical protein